MTRDEFKALLIRLNPANQYAIENNGGGGLPMLTMSTAAHCFTHDVGLNAPEMFKDVQELRNQALNLESKGYFVFDDEMAKP